jgi:hypothetical protein
MLLGLSHGINLIAKAQQLGLLLDETPPELVASGDGLVRTRAALVEGLRRTALCGAAWKAQLARGRAGHLGTAFSRAAILSRARSARTLDACRSVDRHFHASALSRPLGPPQLATASS